MHDPASAVVNDPNVPNFGKAERSPTSEEQALLIDILKLCMFFLRSRPPPFPRGMKLLLYPPGVDSFLGRATGTFLSSTGVLERERR